MYSLNLQVLLVTQRKPLVDAIAALFELAPWGEALVDSVSDIKACLRSPALVIYDVVMVEASQQIVEDLPKLREQFEHGSIIVMADQTEHPLLLDCIREGAHDYISLEEISPGALFRTLRYAVERRRAQQKLESSRAQLAQSQKMEAIGRLAAGLAHDFRQYIQIIIGGAKTLERRTANDPENARIVEEISRAGFGANDLVSQVLDFARSGPTQVAETDLSTLVEAQRTLVDALEKTAKVRFCLAEEEMLVQADPVQLSQILLNLVINALDACQAGQTVTVATRRLRLERRFTDRRLSLEPGEYALLEIKDCGSGIPERYQERIFEPFFTTKPRGKGTGLGLSTVYNLVASLSGRICFWTLDEVGTTFTVFIPLTREVRASELQVVPTLKLGVFLADPFERTMLRHDFYEYGVALHDCESVERVKSWLSEGENHEILCDAVSYTQLKQAGLTELRGVLLTALALEPAEQSMRTVTTPYSRAQLVASCLLGSQAGA